MSTEQYRQIRAYAAQYGTLVGLIWIASFASFVIGLTRPMLSNLALLIGLSSVAVAGYQVRKFRREIYDLRFASAWWMSLLIFIYAALLMAVAQFVYFRYLDNGFMADTYAAILEQPEAIAMMQSMMPGEDVQELTTQSINLLRSITPIQLTIEFLIYNIFIGLLLAVPSAWIGRNGKGLEPNSQN